MIDKFLNLFLNYCMIHIAYKIKESQKHGIGLFADQDIKNGNGCCFIDPHGQDLLKIMGRIPKERWDDVIYFDPAYTERPMGLNMLEFDRTRPEQKTFVINELFSIFKKLLYLN